ncbi:MAG: SRPBCC family protein [Arenimonas sp.]
MHEVCVSHDFNFPIEKVFTGISNHVEFLSTSNIQCRMIRAGDGDPNGLNAMREVRKGNILFQETINAFEPPNAYEYRILALRGPLNIKLPFHHQHGRLQLQSVDGKTRIEWTTRFRFAVPLIGEWIERRLGKSISASFVFFIKRLDARLQESSGRA